MTRWWNVKSTTPSGITINRAWHLRQFLFALIPPATALLLMESAKYWGGSMRPRENSGKKALHDKEPVVVNGNSTKEEERESTAVIAFKVASNLVETAATYAKGIVDEEMKKLKMPADDTEKSEAKSTGEGGEK